MLILPCAFSSVHRALNACSIFAAFCVAGLWAVIWIKSCAESPSPGCVRDTSSAIFIFHVSHRAVKRSMICGESGTSTWTQTVFGMACGGRAVVRFITINSSSSAPFSGRVDSIRLIAFHDPESSMINVNSSPSMASRLSSILQPQLLTWRVIVFTMPGRSAPRAVITR